MKIIKTLWKNILLVLTAFVIMALLLASISITAIGLAWVAGLLGFFGDAVVVISAIVSMIIVTAIGSTIMDYL